MKRLKWKKARKRRLLLILVAMLSILVVILVVILIMLGELSQESKAPEVTSLNAEKEVSVSGGMDNTQNSNIVGTAEADKAENQVNLPDLLIETPFVTLYYPAEWANSVRAEVKEDEIGAEVLFYGNVNGKEEWLFTICFGGADGYPVGVYQTKEGYLLDVTIAMSELTVDDSWTREDVSTICAMQEGVNYVLEKLTEDQKFTLN